MVRFSTSRGSHGRWDKARNMRLTNRQNGGGSISCTTSAARPDAVCSASIKPASREVMMVTPPTRSVKEHDSLRRGYLKSMP